MKPHDLDLMQHADGELELEVGDALALDKIEAIGHGKELVRGHLELSADAVPEARFAAMWAQIGKALDHATPEPAVEVPRRSAWQRLGGWFDRYRGHIFTGVVSAGAVAALALILGPSRDDGTQSGGSGAIDVRPVVHRPTEIEKLDTPAGNGTVLNLQDEDGNTTVIWVTPEDTVEGI